jgi:hypothetical protein
VTVYKWRTAPHVMNFVLHHNKLAHWARGAVVGAAKPEAKTRALAQLVQLAHACWQRFCNFEAVFALCAGLRDEAVASQRALWRVLDADTAAKWAQLEQLVSPTQHFRAYREAYAAAVAARRPRIPFLGVLLGELVLAHPRLRDAAAAPSAPRPAHDAPLQGAIFFPSYRHVYETAQVVLLAQTTRYRDAAEDEAAQTLLRETLDIVCPPLDAMAQQLLLWTENDVLLFMPRVQVGTWEELLGYLFW